MSDERILPPKAIVVGLNGSSGSLRALRWAVDEAALRSMPLQMVHTWQRGSHDYAGGEDQRHTLQLEAVERATGWVLDVCGVNCWRQWTSSKAQRQPSSWNAPARPGCW